MIDTIRIGHMIGPPLRKFSTKKFLSKALCSGVGLAVGVPVAPGEVAVVVVVVAGDMAAVDGDIPGAGERPGTVAEVVGAVVVVVVPGAVAGDITGAVAGLVAVVGGGPGGLAGGGWPNEVSARVTEARLAISSVFIGLIREFSRPRFPMSWVSS
jgi:hypothetical protein